jgi:hypothetical protein
VAWIAYLPLAGPGRRLRLVFGEACFKVSRTEFLQIDFLFRCLHFEPLFNWSCGDPVLELGLGVPARYSCEPLWIVAKGASIVAGNAERLPTPCRTSVTLSRLRSPGDNLLIGAYCPA